MTFFETKRLFLYNLFNFIINFKFWRVLL